MKRSFWTIFFVALGVGLGFVLGYSSEKGMDASPSAPIRLSGEYRYVSPLLLCNGSGGNASSRDIELEKSLQNTIEAVSSDAIHVSVYYRDLLEGSWIGVNENEQFAPSSMLKVPIAIAYFKVEEMIPDLFEREIRVQDGGVDYNANEYFQAEQRAEVGGQYSIAALLHLMLRYSDNNAKILLDQLLSVDAKQEVYGDLGLSFPAGVGNEADFMSVQDYARFFRVLYNGTYLSPDSSETLLSWLTEGRFSAGLSAALPPSVAIAEKFGENVVPEEGDSYNELHDCGIIYYPEHPYLLCVMTKSTESFETLSSLIQHISEFMYQKMDEEYGG